MHPFVTKGARKRGLGISAVKVTAQRTFPAANCTGMTLGVWKQFFLLRDIVQQEHWSHSGGCIPSMHASRFWVVV